MLNAFPTFKWKDKSFWAKNRSVVRTVLVMVEETDEGMARNLGLI